MLSVLESFENGTPKLVKWDNFVVFGYTDRKSDGSPVFNDIADFPMVICRDTDDLIGFEGWMFENRINYPILAYIQNGKWFKMLEFYFS